MRRTRSQLRAAQIAQLAAEQAAYEKSVNEAMKTAAFARCDAVEQLYELLEVKPEPPITRDGKNGPYEVATDRDEVKRSVRLIDAVSRLLTEVEAQPSLGGARVANVQAPHGDAAAGRQFATVIPGPLTGLQPTG